MAAGSATGLWGCPGSCCRARWRADGANWREDQASAASTCLAITAIRSRPWTELIEDPPCREEGALLRAAGMAWRALLWRFSIFERFAISAALSHRLHASWEGPQLAIALELPGSLRAPPLSLPQPGLSCPILQQQHINRNTRPDHRCHRRLLRRRRSSAAQMRAPAAFELQQTISGAAPQQVYQHLCNPHSLLGLQPLLVAVEGVREQAAAGEAAAEVHFEAVEAFRLRGWPVLHNRIRVRQQLLGGGSGDGSDADPLRMRYFVTSPPLGLVRLEVLWTFSSAASAAHGAAAEAASPAVGPPASREANGPAAATRQGGNSSSSSRSGTVVQLEVRIQAPWLLR